MHQNKILLYIIIAIAAMYLGLQLFGYEDNANIVRPLIAPLLVILHMVCRTINRSIYLLTFLILFSVSELMEYSVGYIPRSIIYYFGNSFYILAYVFLTLEIYSNMKSELLFKKYIFQIIILLILDVFCVYLLTDITGLESIFDLFFELLYNVVIMVMVSLAMLSFFSRSTNKSMYLLIGVVCLVASEILTVAYHYIDNKLIFSNTYSILFVIGINFVFRQAYLKHHEFKLFEQAKTS